MQASGSRAAVPLFAATLAVQFGHELEHFVQVIQAKVQHHGPPHGLFGRVFDTEWVHFGYNVVLFTAMAAVLAAYRASIRSRPSLAARVFVAGVLFQGYHVAEHVVKVVQHVGTGATPAPGILGAHVDLVWLHFTYNLIVSATMLIGFVGLGAARARRPDRAGRLALG